MYVRVFDPNGEPFEVTRERADVLILQHGWTQSKTVVSAPVKVSEPDPEPVEDDEPADEDKPKSSRKTFTKRGRGKTSVK